MEPPTGKKMALTALYLDGNGTYADIPSVSLFQLPAFSITCWVKVLEPATISGHTDFFHRSLFTLLGS